MAATVTCIVPENDHNATRKARGSPRRGRGRHNDGGVCLGGASTVPNQYAFGLVSSFLLEMSPLTQRRGPKLLNASIVWPH
jgi:hypothetical protein